MRISLTWKRERGEKFNTYHWTTTWIIKPFNQLNGGAFPTTTSAHQSEGFPGVDRQTQAPEDLYIRPGGVGEMDVLKLNLPIKCFL